MSRSRRSNKQRSQGTQRYAAQGAARGARAQAPTRDFWGSFDDLPEGDERVHPAADPAAVVLSLGSPPLVGHEQLAEHYFRAIYERAGGLAYAVAAGNAMIAE
ncbi:MAG: hypothetical protein M9952_09555 [Microthrixaceae bacterium]|nr:hypothetical protein [Microthrixaceae bacterium]